MSDVTFMSDQGRLTNAGAGMGAAGYLQSGGGVGSFGGIVTQTRDSNGELHTEWDYRALGNSALQFGAAAASGAASFSAAAGPYGAIAGAGLGMLATGIQGGLAAYDAHKCIAALRALSEEARLSGFVTLMDAIDWLVDKQGVKRAKGAAKASVIGQPFSEIYKAGKGIMKLAQGTKGVNRAKYAEYFMETAKRQGKDGEIARKVIAAVVQQDFEGFLKKSLSDAFKSG